MKNSNNSKIERLAVGHYKLESGEERKYVPVDGEPNTWELERNDPILSPSEEAKAKALGFDLEKVLRVKIYLLKGLGPMAIKKVTGISRSAVYKYKKILSVKDSKIQVKDSETTGNVKNVFPISLILISVSSETTFSVFLILVPVLVLSILGYVRHKWGIYVAEQMLHKDEVSLLYFQFTQVCNLSFRREPIICNSEIEVTYFKKLLKYYNNQGRDVIAIERKKGQSPTQHWESKEIYKRQYESANRYAIREGRENASRHWTQFQDRNLLDYLSTPKKENWKESEEFIYSAVDFYLENSAPSVGDQARQKYLMNLIPKRNENKINERKSLGLRI